MYNTYLMIWTTTPWTLPANVAAAVHPDLDYVKIKSQDEYLFIVKDRLPVIQQGYEIIEAGDGGKNGARRVRKWKRAARAGCSSEVTTGREVRVERSGKHEGLPGERNLIPRYGPGNGR